MTVNRLTEEQKQDWSNKNNREHIRNQNFEPKTTQDPDKNKPEAVTYW